MEQQTESDEDLEKAMEEFLKAQQEKESGRHPPLTPLPKVYELTRTIQEAYL